MTPQQEKAKDIVLYFSSTDFSYDDNDGYNIDINLDRHSAKKCASKLVNEILLALEVDSWGDVYKFYTEVKIEIEKL